jgi:hypothetical protein
MQGGMMKRYLLFDSACSQCSQIARSLEQVCGGWCTVRSLREPSMQELLEKTNPLWKWEPTLVEVYETNIRSFTGLRFRIHLIKELGLPKTWQLLQTISRIYSFSSSVGKGRRRLLKLGSAFFSAFALTMGISNLEHIHAQENTKGSSASFSMTPVSITDPFIQQLRQMDVFLAIGESLGIPDWTTVFKVKRGSSHNAVYLINYHPRTSHEIIKTTYLGITTTSKAIVAHLLHTDAQKIQFAWLTPDMYYLGMTTTSIDGHVAVSTENPYHLGTTNTIVPNFAWSCFITCLANAHVPDWCIQICQFCWLPPACVACAGCAAGAYAYCVATC